MFFAHKRYILNAQCARTNVVYGSAHPERTQRTQHNTGNHLAQQQANRD